MTERLLAGELRSAKTALLSTTLLRRIGGVIVIVDRSGTELDCSNEIDARIVEEAHKLVTLWMEIAGKTPP